MSLFQKTGLLAAIVSVAGTIAVFPLPGLAQDALPEDDISQNLQTGNSQNEDGSIIIYSQPFFAQYPNAVSILDIINRIPAGQAILGNGGGGNNRGFSSNEDRVLINGKRVSGKANDSQSVLQRITIEQVVRIEIIRGTSPDIKVQSTESLMNIVLNESAGGASGSFEGTLRYAAKRGSFQTGGFASYGQTFGNLDFFVSGEFEPHNSLRERVERFLDQNGDLTQRLNEDIHRNLVRKTLSTSLIYTFNNNDQIRLNGRVSEDGPDFSHAGKIYQPNATGTLLQTGTSSRESIEEGLSWELGGDWETGLSDTLQLRVLGLWSRDSSDDYQQEDLLITENPQINDFRFDFNSIETELIGRTSVVWTANNEHSLEIGTEMANNKQDTDFVPFERVGNDLVLDAAAISNTIVKELRNESFAIHTWRLNENTTIDSTLQSEWSELSQSGDTNQQRSFFFLKPAINIRHNLDSSNQIQLAFRRIIDQLNFGDFASSASEDNEIIEGNSNLVPQKQWLTEISYEHRLPNDGGRLQANFKYSIYQDRIERIETSPGISGNGNIGDGRAFRLELGSSIRLGFLGLPDLLLEPNLIFTDTQVTDPFTGEKRRFSFWNSFSAELNFRHDINKWGLSYGGRVTWDSKRVEFDIDETRIIPGRERLNLFIEKQLFAGLNMRLDAYNLTNRTEGRNRLLYAAGVASGLQTGTELRRDHFGPIFVLSARGTF